MLNDPSSFSNQKHRFVLDTPCIDSQINSRFKGLLRNAADFRPKASTLRAIRKASSHSNEWKWSLVPKEENKVYQNHALQALSSKKDVYLATNPRRISRKLNALRGQLASAPASLQGHLHSACYEALLKSGDLTTTSHHRSKLDPSAPSMRSGLSPAAPRSILMSNSGRSTPVCAHPKLAANSYRWKTRPSSVATAAANAAIEAAKARKKLRTAPGGLYSDYDIDEFKTSSRASRDYSSTTSRKLHRRSTLDRWPDSAMKMSLTPEERQRRACCPIKSVRFTVNQATSPYKCKMSNQLRAKKSKSYRELNYTGVTRHDGLPLDVQYMELKAKNSVEPLVQDSNSSKRKITGTLDLLDEEVEAQQEWYTRLARNLKQQKDILSLIKRTQSSQSRGNIIY